MSNVTFVAEWMNTVNTVIRKNFQTTSCVYSVNQGISIILIDQIPTYTVFKKVYSMLV